MAQSERLSEGLTAEQDKKKRIFAIVGASSGNFVEWFDFYVYSFCSIYFSAAFFPSGNTTTQLLQTAGVFAAGFFMRPIGGWLFGYIADKHGRKKSMLIAVCMMCAGSLAIACVPTYASIGSWAPALLLLARLFQGLSVGGEYGTSATYMSEVAVKNRRGFFASFQYVTLIGGQLGALLVLVILQQIFSKEELTEWAWRIPFALGAALAIVALILRRSLDETSDEKSRNHKDAGKISALWKHKKAFLMVVGFTAGGSLSFYTFTTYMQKYLVNSAGMDAKTASGLMTVALLVYMLLQPVIGGLSDKIGRRNSMLIFGGLGTLLTMPILYTLQDVSSPYLAFILIVVALSIITFYSSISGLLKAEMFPPEVRALGVGLSYAVANALFGGSAEYVALTFKSWDIESAFFWYVSAMCLLAFIVSLKLHTKGKEIQL